MPVHLGLPPKRHRERTKRSQFAAEDRTLGSDTIIMEACLHRTAPLFPTEASS